MVTHCSRVLVGVGELNRFQASGLPLPTPRFKASSNLPSPPHQMPPLPQVQGIKDTIKSMTATGALPVPLLTAPPPRFKASRTPSRA